MEWKKTTIMLLLGTLLIVGMATAAPGVITNNGDGTWTYSKTATEATWNNYVTYYTENWPDKYYNWLEGVGGCVVDYDSATPRNEQLDACKTPAKSKQYLEDHLDEILNGEYFAEKTLWNERQQTPVTGSLD